MQFNVNLNTHFRITEFEQHKDECRDLSHIGVSNLEYTGNNFGSITFISHDFDTILSLAGTQIEVVNTHKTMNKIWAKLLIKKNLIWGDINDLIVTSPNDVAPIEVSLTFDCEFLYCEFFGIKDTSSKRGEPNFDEKMLKEFIR